MNAADGERTIGQSAAEMEPIGAVADCATVLQSSLIFTGAALLIVEARGVCFYWSRILRGYIT